MADVASAPSAADAAQTASSGILSSLAPYKETALLLLTFFVPPAAVAVRQGKVDVVESRHLALSLALYLSVICYLPAVVHAYWLLYVRDNGGVEEWAGARARQLGGFWNEHGGIAKTKVDEITPKVMERVERVRTYTSDKVKYATEKKDAAWNFVTETTSAAHSLYDDGREAYAAGNAIDWAKEKAHVAVEKIKAALESYPRLQALVHYVEQRVPLVLEFLGKIYETIRSKLEAAHADEDGQPGDDSTVTCGDILAALPRPPLSPVQEVVVHSEEHEGTEGSGSVAESPKSCRTEDMYETADDEVTGGDNSFNEAKTEEEYSQEL